MTTLAALCIFTSAITVELAPDQPGQFLYLDEPFLIALHSETAVEARIELTIDTPGQDTLHHFLEPLALPANRTVWREVPLEALAGPHEFSVRVVSEEFTVEASASRTRIHRAPAGLRSAVSIEGGETLSEYDDALTALVPESILIEQAEDAPAPVLAMSARVGAVVLQRLSGVNGNGLQSLSAEAEAWPLAWTAVAPVSPGVHYIPPDPEALDEWRLFHALAGEQLDYATWRVNMLPDGGGLDVVALTNAARVGAEPSLRLSGGDPGVLAEWTAWAHIMHNATYIADAPNAVLGSVPVFRLPDGSWVAVLNEDVPLDPLPAAPRYLDRYANPIDRLRSGVPARFIRSDDVDFLMQLALDTARTEAVELEAILDNPAITPPLEPGSFVAPDEEDDAEFDRRGFFETITLFPELIAIDRSIGAEAYFEAEMRLARLTRLLAVCEETRGEPFMEPVAERALRCRVLRAEVAEAAVPGTPLVDPVAQAVDHQVDEWLAHAASLESYGLINEARAVAAAAEWRTRANVRRLVEYNREAASTGGEQD